MTDPIRTTVIEELLQARFDPTEHKSFRGNDGRTMTYVEDETVMDRLDEVLGFGAWGTRAQAISTEPAIALVTLRVRDPRTGEWTEFSDFGYANNKAGDKRPSDEPLKEAWTDAFRRVCRQPGVARYVYAGEIDALPSTTQGQAPAAPVHSAAPAVSPQPVVAATPAETPAQPQAQNTGVCPVHGYPWTEGKYGPYCKSKAREGESQNARGYCNLKPAAA